MKNVAVNQVVEVTEVVGGVNQVVIHCWDEIR